VQSEVGEHVLWSLGDDFFVFDRTNSNLERSTAKGNEAPDFMENIIYQLLSDNEGRNISTFVDPYMK
jgi:hypothetical protein